MNFIKLLSDDPIGLRNARIAFLGGGGKTTLMHKIANELTKSFSKVLISSLTKSASHPEEFFLSYDSTEFSEIPKYFDKYNPLFLMKSGTAEKLNGLSSDELLSMAELSQVCLFECDGTRRKPLKAHVSHDPEVPAWTTHCFILVGADVVGTSLNDGFVHRPKEFSKLWNIQFDTILNARNIAKILTSKKGYLSKIPDGVNFNYFVNKADMFEKNARSLANEINQIHDEPVFYGSLHQNRFMVIQ